MCTGICCPVSSTKLVTETSEKLRFEGGGLVCDHIVKRHLLSKSSKSPPSKTVVLGGTEGRGN